MGVYAPLTGAGTIVTADGLVASCYVNTETEFLAAMVIDWVISLRKGLSWVSLCVPDSVNGKGDAL